MSNISAINAYRNMSNGFTVLQSSLPSVKGSLSGLSSLFSGGTVRSMAQASIFPTLYDMGLYGKNTAQSSAQATDTYNVKKAADDLKSSIDALTASGSKSVFNTVQAVSSDEEALTVTNNKSTTLKMVDKQIDIDQIATTQRNVSAALKAKQKELPEGLYAYSVLSGGEKANIRIEVKKGDTNEEIMRKMAEAINKEDLNVTARVEKDTIAGTAQLILESKSTGEKNGFTVTDTQGDLAARMGIDTASQAAQDAIYSVDGKIKTSASNNVDLGDGVTATLKKATAATVTVSAQRGGSAAAVSAVQDMVSSFNNLMSVSDRAGSELSRMAKTYASSLSRLGINVDTDGKLSVDEGKLKKAIDDGWGESALTDRLGTIGRIADKASSISRSANTYSNVFGYTGSGSAYGVGSYLGLMFDSFI